MAQPEKVAETFAMIIVDMGDADGIVVVASGFGEIAPQFLCEITAQVVLIVSTAHVGVIDENLPPVCQINAQRVGVTEREEMDFCNHVVLHTFGLVPSGTESCGLARTLPAAEQR